MTTITIERTTSRHSRLPLTSSRKLYLMSFSENRNSGGKCSKSNKDVQLDATSIKSAQEFVKNFAKIMGGVTRLILTSLTISMRNLLKCPSYCVTKIAMSGLKQSK